MTIIRSKFKSLFYISASVFCLIHFSDASESGVLVDKTNKNDEKPRLFKKKIDKRRFVVNKVIPEEMIEEGDTSYDLMPEDPMEIEKKFDIDDLTEQFSKTNFKETKEEKIASLIKENKNFFDFIDYIKEKNKMRGFPEFDLSKIINYIEKYGFQDVTFLQMYPKDFVFINKSGMIVRLKVPKEGKTSELEISLCKGKFLKIIKNYCENPDNNMIDPNIMILFSDPKQDNIEEFKITEEKVNFKDMVNHPEDFYKKSGNYINLLQKRLNALELVNKPDNPFIDRSLEEIEKNEALDVITLIKEGHTTLEEEKKKKENVEEDLF